MIEIVFQHADFVVINKPANLGVHVEAADPDMHQSGLLVQLAHQLGVEQLYPVHRLDKVTSGLMLVAKTAKAASELSQLFQHRQIEKYYLAISDKKPKKKQGTVSGAMQPSRRGSWKLLADNAKADSKAITQFFSQSIGDKKRLFLLKPLTGKTHQIRVMMKSLSAAILGDSLYASTSSDRCYLHAYGIKFQYQGGQFFVLRPPVEGSEFLNSAVNQLLTQQWSHPDKLNWPNTKKK